MLIKFQRLFNYIDIIKMDMILSKRENMYKVMRKFEGTHIKLLAQSVDTKELYNEAIELGFEYFQGQFVDKATVMEIDSHKEPSQIIILQLINIIKNNNSTEELEKFIKLQADLSYKLISFLTSLSRLT